MGPLHKVAEMMLQKFYRHLSPRTTSDRFVGSISVGNRTLVQLQTEDSVLLFSLVKILSLTSIGENFVFEVFQILF